MKKLFSFVAALCAITLWFGAAGAQTPSADTDPSITQNGAIGEVKVVDLAGKQFILKTDAGSLVTIVFSDAAQFLRVAPGEKTLTNATKITAADVSEGDRVFGRGQTSTDKKTVTARAVVVMSKVDLAKKQEAERAEWKKRGIVGIITAVKPDTREISMSTRSLAGQQTMIIPVNDKVEMRRYAPDSIKFADAKPAKFEELQVGDQVRALGDKTPDGAAFSAEKIVTGSFKTVAGVVTALDAQTGEVKINDMLTKQPLTIVVKQDAVLRKFPAAAEIAMRQGGGGPQGSAPPAGAGGPAGAGRPGGGMNIQDMLERLPTIALADVKVGDTIMVSSTKGADPTRLTAITLISGADTLLNIVAARQPQAAGQSAPNPAAGLGSGIQFGIGLP